MQIAEYRIQNLQTFVVQDTVRYRYMYMCCTMNTIWALDRGGDLHIGGGSDRSGRGRPDDDRRGSTGTRGVVSARRRGWCLGDVELSRLSVGCASSTPLLHDPLSLTQEQVVAISSSQAQRAQMGRVWSLVPPHFSIFDAC